MTPSHEPCAAPEEAYCPACGGSYPLEESFCPREGTRLVKLKAQVDPMIGRVLEGRYEVRAVLGAGGMGTVYRGYQLSVEREVAIKVIHATFAADRTAVKRFLREARLSSRIAQPSVVSVYDFGQTEAGELYLVMELLRGHTLERELDAGQPIPIGRVAGIGLQLCNALDAAHTEGIVHRDLKPANIIVLDDPAVLDLIKVLDFGLARSLAAEDMTRVTMSNAILGTPMYMAPEQIRGCATDQRADLYALGCILFHMLVGRAPFDGDSINGLLAAHLNDPIPTLPATLPTGLARAIQRLLAKDPDERAASVAEVRVALQSALAAPSTMPVVKRSRGRWLAVLAVLAVLVAIPITAVVARGRDPEPRAPAPPPSPPAAAIATPTPSPIPIAEPSPPPVPTKPPKSRRANHKPASAPTIDFYPKP